MLALVPSLEDTYLQSGVAKSRNSCFNSPGATSRAWQAVPQPPLRGSTEGRAHGPLVSLGVVRRDEHGVRMLLASPDG